MHFIVIVLGGWVDLREADAIASFPHSSNVIAIQDYGILPEYRDNIKQLICNSESR